MNKVAIIQARMGSTRLPGKALMDIAGHTMIERVIERTATVSAIDKVVVAIPDEAQDDLLENFITQRLNIPVFRGSTNDVLKRYYDCAVEYEADIIIRVTADDPLKDPTIISHALALLVDDDSLDYCSNTLKTSYPEGLDIEVFRFKALESAHQNACLDSEREHVTPYIWKHPNQFKLYNFESDRDLSSWRWTVDYQVDLEFMRAVFNHFKNEPLISYQSIVSWLEQHPDVQQINSGVVRNEGYLKSVESENQ